MCASSANRSGNDRSDRGQVPHPEPSKPPTTVALPRPGRTQGGEPSRSLPWAQRRLRRHGSSDRMGWRSAVWTADQRRGPHPGACADGDSAPCPAGEPPCNPSWRTCSSAERRMMASSPHGLLRLLGSLCSAHGLELVRSVAERMLSRDRTAGASRDRTAGAEVPPYRVRDHLTGYRWPLRDSRADDMSAPLRGTTNSGIVPGRSADVTAPVTALRAAASAADGLTPGCGHTARGRRTPLPASGVASGHPYPCPSRRSSGAPGGSPTSPEAPVADAAASPSSSPAREKRPRTTTAAEQPASALRDGPPRPAGRSDPKIPPPPRPRPTATRPARRTCSRRRVPLREAVLRGKRAVDAGAKHRLVCADRLLATLVPSLSHFDSSGPAQRGSRLIPARGLDGRDSRSMRPPFGATGRDRRQEARKGRRPGHACEEHEPCCSSRSGTPDTMPG